MHITKRHFLTQLAGLQLAAALPSIVAASTSVGSAQITTLSDGHLVLPGSFAFDGLPQDALAALLANMGLDAKTVTPECNLTLYQDGTNTVLFDVGSGHDFMPTAGRIVDSLNAVGLSPDDITHVVFTHAHPDHIGGLLDDFDDPLFVNASYLMGRAEWDYWWDPSTVSTIGDARASFAVGAKRRMTAIADAVTLFDDGQEILPGIGAIASYGHTPGHMSFEIHSATGSALILGDAIGNHHIAFRKPNWASPSDQDPQTAIRSRNMLFDRAMANQMKLIGFHLPNGGIGHAERLGDAYTFIPETM
jgi:glyoxylase-like metal-dependent hydrolase (beta-lactamase superfamily II)